MQGRLYTPEEVLFDGEVEFVALRRAEGDAMFLPGHIPLVGAVVEEASVRFSAAGGAGEMEAMLTSGGFVEVDGEVVTVSAPVAALSSTKP